MNHRYDKKRGEAGGKTLPAHDQTPILPLEPGKRPLNLVARHILFDRAPARFLGFPDAFGNLGAGPTCAEATAEASGIIPFIRRQDLESLTRSTPSAGVGVQGIQPREDLGVLITIRGRRPRGQWHDRPIGEAVDEDTLFLAVEAEAAVLSKSGVTTTQVRCSLSL
jgi:hypothetical protein